MIKKMSNGYGVYTKDGKKLIHKFKTRKKAIAMLRAIEISKVNKI